MIVGGGHRGVVLSANYLAREYGVRSALPMTRARRLCPQAVVLPPDYDTVHLRVGVGDGDLPPGHPAGGGGLPRRGVPRRPRVDPAAGLPAGDRRAAARHHPRRAGDHLLGGRRCGRSTVAKLASRRAKPDGVLVVPPTEVTSFLHPLDVGELWGVGEKTQAMLHRLGLRTVGDLAHTPERTLRGRSATRSGGTCAGWPGVTTAARSSSAAAATSPTVRWGPTRPSAATPTTAR